MLGMNRLLQRYTDSVLAKPFYWFAFYVVITVLAFVFGQPDVKTDLAELLPEDAPAVIALEEGRARRGGGGEYFSIAVASPDPVANAKFMEAIATKMREWPETNYVVVDQDKSFFRNHALLFLPVEDLANIRDNLQRLVREQLAQNNPLFVDLTEEDRAELNEESPEWRDPATWVNPMTFRELGMSEAEVNSLFPFREEEAAADATPKVTIPVEYQDFRLSPDGTVGIVMASVKVSSTDVKGAHELYDRGTALVQELNPSSFHPEMDGEVVGAFRDFLEVRKLMADANTATVVSLGAVILLLVVFFRSFRAVAIVALPLIVGVGWSLFLITMIFGQLNTLTAFIFAMLIGMGIDYSIHIYQRALDEFHSGETWNRAIYLALTRAGRALLTAMMTTVAALGVMAMSTFHGFQEFGLACGMGVLTCLAATVLVLPVVIGVSERIRPLTRHEKRGSGSYVGDQNYGPMRFRTGYRVLAVCVLAFAAFGALSAPDAQFEYNFRNLSGPSIKSRISYGAALGGNRSSAPAVVLGDSQEQMREVHHYLRQEMRGGDERISGFLTVETFLPSDQAERMEVIDDIHDILDRRAVRELPGKEGELVATMLELTDTEPFTQEDLPGWVAEQLTEVDGSFGRMGLIYADVEWWNVLNVRDFQDKYGTIKLPDAEVSVASSGFILDNVVRYVQADAGRLATMVLIALLVILLIDLRSIVATMLCMSTLGVGVLITLAGLVFFDVKLGLYNMVVLPTILGIGIDGSVHLYHRFLEEGRTNVWRVMRSTGTAVLASSLTTIAGFIGLVFVEHKGIQTIGQLAIIGIVANMFAVLGLMPGIMTLFRSDAERAAKAGVTPTADA